MTVSARQRWETLHQPTDPQPCPECEWAGLPALHPWAKMRVGSAAGNVKDSTDADLVALCPAHFEMLCVLNRLRNLAARGCTSAPAAEHGIRLLTRDLARPSTSPPPPPPPGDPQGANGPAVVPSPLWGEGCPRQIRQGSPTLRELREVLGR